jgi:hypothetical protein
MPFLICDASVIEFTQSCSTRVWDLDSNHVFWNLDLDLDLRSMDLDLGLTHLDSNLGVLCLIENTDNQSESSSFKKSALRTL